MHRDVVRRTLGVVTASPMTPAVPGPAPAGSIDTSLPFTRQEGLAAGIRVSALEGRQFQRLHAGIYIAAGTTLTPAIQARAALRCFPEGAVASHLTAARVLGVPVPAIPGEHVTVRRRRDRRSRDGIRCHLAVDARAITVAGVGVSPPAQVFVELASQLTLIDLVIVGDHLVKAGSATINDLKHASAGASGPGAAQARAAVVFVRPGVESPMETRLRLLLVMAGLPEPTINMTIATRGERSFRRFDLCWPEARLVVEYDGKQHRKSSEQVRADEVRRRELEDEGWRLVVFTSPDIFDTPAATVAVVHRLLRERRQPGVRTRTGDAWRPHFPGRT